MIHYCLIITNNALYMYERKVLSERVKSMIDGKTLVFAGISSLYGLNDIKNYFEEMEINTVFIESKFMSKFIHEEVNYISCDSFEIEKKDTYLFLPLNEYWLTYAYKNKLASISKEAYLSSRSKKHLSKLLEQSGIPNCKILSIDEAYKFVEQGKKVLVKPDNYYSGHGVKIINKNNIGKIESYILTGKEITEEAKNVLGNKEVDVEIWEYLEGEEFSADIFVYKLKCKVLRLCRKRISIINDAPCNTAYFMITEHDTGITEEIKKWVNTIFDKNDISFAHFDFIREKTTNQYIPIDFSCRVGGGMKELLEKCGSNIYLDGLKIINNQWGDSSKEMLYQLNILPTQKGVVYNDEYGEFSGELIKIKKRNDVVLGVDPSANNRLAIVIGHMNQICEDEICDHVLLKGKDFIK